MSWLRGFNIILYHWRVYIKLSSLNITERIVEGIVVALFFHPTIARARVDNWRVRRGEDEI